MHINIVATILCSISAALITAESPLSFHDSICKRETVDTTLLCLRLHIVCEHVYTNAQLEDYDLADEAERVDNAIQDFQLESQEDGDNCINGDPLVDQGQPTCVISKEFSWGKRFECSFTIRRWRKTCNDPPTGRGRKTEFLERAGDIKPQDFATYGTATVETANVHCGEQ